ncbi:hypothetical protein HUU42_01790 [bacterium]|nr:hypothetical protein [bacterium]
MKTFFYRLMPKNLFVKNAPSIVFENEIGRFELISELLTIRTSIEDRGAVELFLRAWEFEHEVIGEYPKFYFEFIQTKKIKANQSKIQSATQFNEDENEDEDWMKNETIVIQYNFYPHPPTIKIVLEMEAIWNRFQRSRLGIGEPLQACAYYALTVIEKKAGSRKEASKLYSLDINILRKLGELTSNRGEPMTARKALKNTKPLTPIERRWIELVVRYIILHMGLSQPKKRD